MTTATTTTTVEPLMNKHEVAEIFGCHWGTVIRYAKSGKLRFSKPGGKEYRFARADVENCIAAGMSAPPVTAVEPKPARNPRKYPNAK
jgi:excisionase family DNA binding protein